MNILVTGSSGLVGTALCEALKQKQYSVYKLTRDEENNGVSSPQWNIDLKDGAQSIVANTIIHLAGENIAGKRWNDKQKQEIYNSRILGTRNLVNKIISSTNKPQTFLCASAIGFYGDRGDEILTEDSEAGDNFVAKISKDWEKETLPLKDHGIRVVNLRFGVILSKEDGALKKMLLPFKLGLGGAIGKGQQQFSWISIDDAITAIIHIIKSPTIFGPVNITSPNPVTNKAFSKALAKQLNRPAFIDMPASICRLAFGEMANELLLSSQNVLPEKLIESGFTHKHPDIESALQKVLT